MNQINFNTIKGIDQWEENFPRQFTPLNVAQKKRLARTLQSGVHEGWEPTEQQVERLKQQVTGEKDVLTIDEILKSKGLR